MTTNDFLPIATAVGANVQAQAAYAADADRTDFFIDGGIPDANQHGKMFRQASVIANIFAQMICDYSGLDMLDNADLATLLTTIKTQFRIRLRAATTFYVSTAGNDVTGNGSIGTPWRTAQHAADVLHGLYDLNGFVATIMRVAGAYTDTVLLRGPFVGALGPQSVVFDGAGMATVTVTNAVNGVAIYEARGGAQFTTQNQRLVETANSSAAINATEPGSYVVYNNIDFGPTVTSNHIATTFGASVLCNGDYKISGGATAHVGMGANSTWVCQNRIVTVTGTPAWGNAFLYCRDNSTVLGDGITFVGGATGSRYSVSTNGVVNTVGGGASYFPGNSAGAATTGGQYL